MGSFSQPTKMKMRTRLKTRTSRGVALKLLPLRRNDPNYELLLSALALLALIGAWAHPLWAPFTPGLDCHFKKLLGIPCLTCGGTRALLAWSHLRPGVAFVMNPLVAIGAAAMTAWLIYSLGVFIVRPARRLRLVVDFRSEARASRNWTRLGIAAVVILNWIYLIGVRR